MSEVKAVGRPTLFNDDLKEKILKMAEVGLTDKQVGYICGVTFQTVNNWKKANPEFFESLKIAKELADNSVVQSMYRKATGQVVITEKHEGVDANGNIVDKTVTKETAPDTSSMIFWLKNRQPDKWRDKQEVSLEVQTIQIDTNDAEL